MLIDKDALPCLHLKHGDEHLTIFADDDDHIKAIAKLSSIIGCAIPLQRRGTSLISFQDAKHFAANPTPWWGLDAYYKGSKSRGQRPNKYKRGGDFDKDPPRWPWEDNDKWLDFSVVINKDGIVDGTSWCRSCDVQLRCDIAGGPDWVVSNLNDKPFSGLAEGCAFARFSFGGITKPTRARLPVMGEHAITTAALTSAGFTPLPSASLFDSWFGRYGLYNAVECDEADILAADMYERGESIGDLRRFRRRAPMAARPDIDDLCFDTDVVRANQMLSKIRRGNSAQTAARTRKWKGRECTNCVYSCAYIPPEDRRPDVCHVTADRILAENPVGEEELVWMAHFVVAGKKGKFIGRSQGIAWGPSYWTGRPGMLIKSLHPPFSDQGVIDADEYQARFDLPDIDTVAGMLSEEDDDTNRMSLWALKWMHERMRYEHRFYNHTLDDGRFARNDILAIERELTGMIIIHSDTRASSTAMRFSGGYHDAYGDKGRSITADDRPRFQTTYSYPYFEDLQAYAGVTPGSGRGS